MGPLVTSLVREFNGQTAALRDLAALAVGADGKDISSIASGIAEDILSVRAHIADIGLSDDLFNRAAGVSQEAQPEDVLGFLGTREKVSLSAALELVADSNDAAVAEISQWEDDQLLAPAKDPFDGYEGTVFDVWLHKVRHMGIHYGKARQLLHSAGV